MQRRPRLLTHNMSRSLFAINIFLHDSILVYPDGGQYIECVLVTRIDSIKYQAHNDLLPCRTTLIPELGLFEIDNVTDVLHDTVECAGREDFVLVVIGDSNEQLRMPVIHGWAKMVAILECEIVGITGSSGIYRRLAASPSASRIVTYISCA